MSPTALSLFLSSLGLGTMITFSSSHWILAWMGLEINTMAIIPLLSLRHHPRAIEATTKYFLIQAAAAALILFSSILNAWTSGEWAITNLTNPSASMLLSIALAIKLGLAPFHFWLPEVLQGVTLITGLILSTWQKLAPLSLIYLMAPNINLSLLLLLGIISTLVGGWGALNQTHIRKIMAYSSIAHLGWMISILVVLPKLTILNMLLYIILTSSMFLTFKLLNSTKISTLATSWSKTPTIVILSSLTLLSLGGLPPLSGFFPKWLILQELVKQESTLYATILALSALLSLFFYLRLLYTSSLTVFPQSSPALITWRTKSNQSTFLLSLVLIISICSLPILPSIINLFELSL
uniref:NADH-ubiquinone oxidoreductase chain 2 n=1 Tax=Pelobates cultripes TaxID=61616 RepID=Q2HQW0_PELCU|nr:NADH dehydrogenase subunit 2 [Pelobates cultripes]CAI38759.1 NADH dehydrogenase subunit 2 [Pelobates cultripes]